MKFLIALLTAATGVLHLLVGFGMLGGGSTNWLLVLNGVGYLVLLVLFWMASGNGGIIRWILLAYALVTLIGYFVLNSAANFGFNSSIGLFIKAIELLLILLLLLYKGSQTAVATSSVAGSTRTGASIDATRSTGQALSTAAANTAAGASGATAAAAVASMSMADRAGEAITDSVDYAEDKAGEAVYAIDTAADEGVAYVEDKTGEAVDAIDDAAGAAVGAADEAVDYVEDEAGEAVAYVEDEAGEAVGAIDEAAGAAVGAADEAVDYVEVKTGEAVDAAVDVADSAYDASVDATRDVGAAAAAAVSAAESDMAEVVSETTADEPSEDELRADLEEYLRSFGPSSEFRKPIEYIEGIGAAYGQKLRAIEISTVMDLILNGATRRGRKQIADQSGIAHSLILTWVNHVDLFRIKGVAEEYADLLEQSGVDTVMELAQRNPANLYKRMKDVNEQKSLVRRIPHASDVESWVEQAKGLRRLIYY